MELGSAKPCVRTDLEDFLDRLFTKDTDDRHASRCGNQLAGLTAGDGPGPRSKNSAQIGRAGPSRGGRILCPHQSTDLHLSGHVVWTSDSSRRSCSGAWLSESAVPTSTASAPARAALTTSARRAMPLSATAIGRAGHLPQQPPGGLQFRW